MGFSIVTVTHNRYRELKNLLDSISRHMIPELEEIIVVDDSDKKETIPEHLGSVRIKHILLDKRVFISAAKNIGWNSSECETIFFIDDDNVVDGSTFPGPLKILSEGEDIAAVFPSVLYYRDKNKVWVYATPFSKGRWGHILLGRNEERNPAYEDRIIDMDALPNAFLIRRKALSEVAGLDENYPVYNSTLLVFRLKQSGWKVVADTGSFIYHDVELPGNFGFWATHAIMDPGRLYFEVRDWLMVMRIIHSGVRFFSLKALFRAMRFILPNFLVYVLKGKKVRVLLIKNLVRGIVSGLREKSVSFS